MAKKKKAKHPPSTRAKTPAARALEGDTAASGDPEELDDEAERAVEAVGSEDEASDDHDGDDHDGDDAGEQTEEDLDVALSDRSLLVLGATAVIEPDEPDVDDAKLTTSEPLILGAAAAEGDLDDDAALDEFASYDSLDDEYPEDDERVAPVTAESTDGADPDALIPPKQRHVAEMRLEARIEAIVFAAQKPLKTIEIVEILADPGLTEEHVQETLDQLVEFYKDRCGGFRLHYLKRLGYQFQTSEAAGAIMERMFASRPRPISRAALETLSIIAYRQPVTRAEVEFIRGVDAGSIFKTLLERELIKCVGRKEIIGRPMLFGTTDNFLTVFNLSSIKDLPPLESFQPSREAMQGALEKIESGGDLVDVEDYIADNTRGEYEGDDVELIGESEGGEAEAESEPQAERQGAEAATPDETADVESPAAADADDTRETAPSDDAEQAAEVGPQVATAADETLDSAPVPGDAQPDETPDTTLTMSDTQPDETPDTILSTGDTAASDARPMADTPAADADLTPVADMTSTDHGNDADSEVALPTGDRIPEGGGDLDR